MDRSIDTLTVLYQMRPTVGRYRGPQKLHGHRAKGLELHGGQVFFFPMTHVLLSLYSHNNGKQGGNIDRSNILEQGQKPYKGTLAQAVPNFHCTPVSVLHSTHRRDTFFSQKN